MEMMTDEDESNIYREAHVTPGQVGIVFELTDDLCQDRAMSQRH
jgi:hypothetical protein